MNEQDTSPSAVATLPEASPYNGLKQIIEEEQARAVQQQEAQRSVRPPATQPSDAARPTARYGLD